MPGLQGPVLPGQEVVNMEELVTYLARALVDEPEAVQVTAVDRAGMTVYQVAVAPGDVGKIIGRHGRTAGALRALVNAAAKKKRVRATVDIIS